MQQGRVVDNDRKKGGKPGKREANPEKGRQTRKKGEYLLGEPIRMRFSTS
jgi:hypothetical protein